MPIAQLRPHAAPVQDPPRKVSTPVQPRTQPKPQAGLHKKSGVVAHRTPKSHPAVGSATGESGFDGRIRPGGRPELNPQGTNPLGTTGTKGTTSAQAVGSLDPKAVEALFNKASSTYESILGTLGHTRPPIEDATARLLDRSTYLGNVLTGDPSLKDKIKQSDLAQVRALSLVFLQIQDQLQGPQRDASDAFLKTAAMMGARPEWPPPPEN